MAYDDYKPSQLDDWSARAREALLQEQLRHERWRVNFYQSLHRSLKAKAAAQSAEIPTPERQG